MNNGALKFPQPASQSEPDWNDVRQDPQPINSLPVHVQGMVKAQGVPAKRGIGHTWNVPQVGTARPIEVVPGDPRIKNVTFFCGSTNGNIMLGTEEQLNGGTSATLDGFNVQAFLTPPPMEGFEDSIYAIGIGAAAQLSVWITYWAD